MCDINDSSSCGLHGTCVEGLCRCDTGWADNVQFVFEDGECEISVLAEDLLYVVVLITMVLTIFTYASSIKRRSQAKRLIPYFILTFLCIGIAVVKLNDRNKSFSEDPGMAIAFGIAIFLFDFVLEIFLNKYVQFQLRTLKILNAKLQQYIKILDKTSKVLVFLMVCAALLFSSVPFIDDEKIEVKKIITRTAFAINLFSPFYRLVCTLVVLPHLIDAIKSASNTVEHKKNALKSAFIIRNSTIFCNTSGVIVYAITVSSDLGLHGYTYAAPIVFSYCALGSVFIPYANNLVKKSRAKFSSPTAGTSSYELGDRKSVTMDLSTRKETSMRGSFSKSTRIVQKKQSAVF